MHVAEITQLRVDYDEVTAVRDISFHLEKGKIYGFVGPNGAGKTSTIKALAGILEPKQGTIILNGYDLEQDREKALARVGYMPDFPPVYENLKVWEYLDVFSAAYGRRAEDRPMHVDAWLKKVDLNVKRDSLIKGLSRGMRQRLVLAKMLEFEPDLLLLDEPASGLDPIARKQMRDLLKAASADGATILISSHILTELSEFVDSVIILEKGNLVVAGSVDEISRNNGSGQRLTFMFADEEKDRAALGKLLAEAQIPTEAMTWDKRKFTIHFSGDDQAAFNFLAKIIASGIKLSECAIKNDDIEDIFLKVGAKEVS